MSSFPPAESCLYTSSSSASLSQFTKIETDGVNVKAWLIGLSVQIRSCPPSAKSARLTVPSLPGSPGPYRSIRLTSRPEARGLGGGRLRLALLVGSIVAGLGIALATLPRAHSYAHHASAYHHRHDDG